MRRFLYWLTSRLPCRIISDDGTPYLERSYLMTLFGMRFYIHRFVGSDPDREFHDHPWPWAFSLVLSGWYIEMRRRTVNAFRVVRWFNFLTGDTFHRVILPDSQREVWTLFVHRAHVVKEWGFLRGTQGGAIWTPYPHQTGGREWWKEVDKGRDELRRLPL